MKYEIVMSLIKKDKTMISGYKIQGGGQNMKSLSVVQRNFSESSLERVWDYTYVFDNFQWINSIESHKNMKSTNEPWADQVPHLRAEPCDYSRFAGQEKERSQPGNWEVTDSKGQEEGWHRVASLKPSYKHQDVHEKEWALRGPLQIACKERRPPNGFSHVQVIGSLDKSSYFELCRGTDLSERIY